MPSSTDKTGRSSSRDARTGKYDEAVAEYTASLAQEPNNADAILGLAETHKAAGRVKEAEVAYLKAIELRPNYAKSHLYLGLLYRQRRKYGLAIEHLRFAGVQIVTLAEGEISELHVGLKGTMNALFLKDLAAKTHRAQRLRWRESP